MENPNPSQLELFASGKEARETKTTGIRFFSYIWNYEKAILVIIGLIITGVVSFSLGVEKGKGLASITAKDKPAKQEQKASPDIVGADAPVVQAQAKQNVQKLNLVKPLAPKEFRGNFTIQLASYKSKGSAQKEADALRKKGLMPVMLSKGEFIVLCVGNFSNKEAAKLALVNFKKRYQGCLVRRL
jgi:cell division septation protein DedD